MTREEYGLAYEKGLVKTTKLILVFFFIPYSEAHEMAHEAWVKGIVHLDQLKDPNDIQNWINRIALNLVIQKYRQGNRLKTESLDIDSCFHHNGHDHSLEGIDAERCLKMCSQHDREILTERYILGLSEEEMGHKHGYTAGSIKMQVHRALKRLRNTIGVVPRKNHLTTPELVAKFWDDARGNYRVIYRMIIRSGKQVRLISVYTAARLYRKTKKQNTSQ